MRQPSIPCLIVRRWWCLFLSLALLSACAAVEPTKRPGKITPGNYKIGKPYQVGGQWYYPQPDYGYDERGIASWYGPNFHGRRTANGEIFNMNAISGAHKTLPLPSVVRITNLENGRALTVRINDRGPFARGRIVDLSKRAADLLGFADKGTAMVRVHLLLEESRQAALEAGADNLPEFGPPPPRAAPSVAVTVEELQPEGGDTVATSQPPRRQGLVAVSSPSAAAKAPFNGITAVGDAALAGRVDAAAPIADERSTTPEEVPRAGSNAADAVTLVPVTDSPQIFVQAGAFAQYDNANRMRARLSVLGPPVRITQIYVTNQPLFRVRIGPLESVTHADLTLDRVLAVGVEEAQIIVD